MASQTSAIGSSDASTFSIRLLMINSESFHAQVCDSTTIPDFRQIVKRLTGVEENRQRLIFRGKVLANDKRISNYSIAEGMTVHVLERAVPARPTSASASESRQTSQSNEGYSLLQEVFSRLPNQPRTRRRPVVGAMTMRTRREQRAQALRRGREVRIRHLAELRRRQPGGSEEGPNPARPIIDSPQLVRIGPGVSGLILGARFNVGDEPITNGPNLFRSMLDAAADAAAQRESAGEGGGHGEETPGNADSSAAARPARSPSVRNSPARRHSARRASRATRSEARPSTLSGIQNESFEDFMTEVLSTVARMNGNASGNQLRSSRTRPPQFPGARQSNGERSRDQSAATRTTRSSGGAVPGMSAQTRSTNLVPPRLPGSTAAPDLWGNLRGAFTNANRQRHVQAHLDRPRTRPGRTRPGRLTAAGILARLSSIQGALDQLGNDQDQRRSARDGSLVSEEHLAYEIADAMKELSRQLTQFPQQPENRRRDLQPAVTAALRSLGSAMKDTADYLDRRNPTGDDAEG